MEKDLTALIVDDEEKAVALMKKLVEDTQQFSVIRHAFSSADAKKTLHQFHPDLIFLDIKMPGDDGISLLRELHEKKTKSAVVFVTAYDTYALDAIRNHAMGYLLKPVNRRELDECIAHYRATKIEAGFRERLANFLREIDSEGKLRINTRSGYFFIDADDILYCLADGNYSAIFTVDRQHMCSLQLTMVQDMLPKSGGFERVGRSLIVNCKYISKVDRKTNLLTFEKNGKSQTLNVSRSQLRELDSIYCK